MGWIGQLVIGALVQAAGYVVGRALLALGISVVTYTGLATSIGWLQTGAIAAIFLLPPNVVALLSLLKVGVCINMVCSAILARFVLGGLDGDKVKQWVKT